MRSKYLKLLISIGMATVLLLGLIQFAQGFIDTEPYRKQIQAIVQEKTGMEINIRGDIALTLFPTPTLYVPNIELRQPAGALNPSLSADMIYIKPSFTSLFSDALEVASITFERPLLEIERAKDNLIHWGWLNGTLLKASGEAVTIEIVGGGVTYRNRMTDEDWLMQDINGFTVTGSQPRLNGSMAVNGHTVQFDASTEPSTSADGTLPVSISLSSDTGSSMTLAGTVNLSSENLQIKGKVTVQSEDIMRWLRSKEENKSIFNQFIGSAEQGAKQNVAMPLSLSGEWDQSGTDIKITVQEFKGLNSAGAGEIKIGWDKDMLQVVSDVAFSALSYDHWRFFLSHAMQDKNVVQAMSAYNKSLGDTKQNPLPSGIKMKLSLQAQQVYFGNQIWKNAKLSTVLEKGAVTVNQFDVILPGDSSLSLFGLISQSSTREMRFEGSMETSGKSLRQMLTVLDESAMELPEVEFSEFYVRSNIYVAPDQIRLSEADVKIGDLHLNGGLVAYYNVIPRFEAEVQLKDINFDYFRDAWRKNIKEGNKTLSFGWLKKLKASFDLKIGVDGFTFIEQRGDKAAFRLVVQEGSIGVYNANFSYPEEVVQGNVSLDVKGEQPVINVLLNTGVLDTRYFSIDEENKKDNTEKLSFANADNDKRWSDTLLDMNWMEGWKGGFDITIGKLIHRGLTFENVKLRAGLENNLLTVPSLTLTYWRGKCTLSGSMYGGKVPGFSAGFTLYNVELQELLQSLVGRDNIAGKVSINGTLATSGVNLLSWVSQAESELVVAGRGVVVDGFNLQGVVDAVRASRTAADVLNNVNLSLLKGSTEVTVDGNINIKGGLMRTPGLVIRSGDMAGTMAGEVKLVPWTMELTSLYQFPGMSAENIPTMIVQLVGPVQEPKMNVDTASLEAYVAKRITGAGVGR